MYTYSVLSVNLYSMYKATEYYLMSAPHMAYSAKSSSLESDYRFTRANE